MGAEDRETTFDQLSDPEPFPIVDMMVAAGCLRITGGDLSQRVLMMETELSAKRRSLPGRQLLRVICDDFIVSESTSALCRFRDLNDLPM